jgi:glycosyltransferase involved in cell wall biosynthesis
MANKIIALLRYDSLRDTMTQSSKREVQLFTWDRVAERTLDVYRGTT